MATDVSGSTIYNNSDTLPPPIITDENDTISSGNNNINDPEKMNTDDPRDNWFTVQSKRRRYQARILSIHVPGSNITSKQSNLGQALE